MSTRFDEVAKLLAADVPRREALWRLGGMAGAAFLGLFGLGKRGVAQAAQTCRQSCANVANIPAQFGPCVQACCLKVCRPVQNIAIRWQACMQNCKCAPATACGTACVNLTRDPRNCGACGRVCGQGTTCCSGKCVNLKTDPKNCGECGNVCPTFSCSSTEDSAEEARPPASTCVNGVCVGIPCM